MAKKYVYENCEMLSIKDVSKILGVSERFVRNLIDAGKITYIRHSSRLIRISRSAVQKYLDSVMVGNSAEN